MHDGVRALTHPPLRRRWLLLFDCMIVVGCLLAPVAAKLLMALPTDCYVQELGFLCPACGGTRSVILLFRGDVIRAFHMNSYFFLSGITVLLMLILLHISVFSERHYFAKICGWILRPVVAVIWAVGFVLFGILRNLV